MASAYWARGLGTGDGLASDLGWKEERARLNGPAGPNGLRDFRKRLLIAF
jgi:hypothetical protein